MVSFTGILFMSWTFSNIEYIITPTLGYALIHFYKVGNMPLHVITCCMCLFCFSNCFLLCWLELSVVNHIFTNITI